MNFAHRAADLTEHMDNPVCDAVLLENTYRHFARMNRLVAGWRRIYRRWLRPAFDHIGGESTLLDIGCGGGDIPFQLAQWAQHDGFRVHILAIDPDERAIAYARRYRPHDQIDYRVVTPKALDEEGRRFHVVLSNHLLHHLQDEAVANLLDMSGRLSTRLTLHNDIRRSAIAYYLFKWTMPLLFRDAYTVSDGLTSIRRSYRRAELTSLLPRGWTSHAMSPWRVVAVKEEPNRA